MAVISNFGKKNKLKGLPSAPLRRGPKKVTERSRRHPTAIKKSRPLSRSGFSLFFMSVTMTMLVLRVEPTLLFLQQPFLGIDVPPYPLGSSDPRLRFLSILTSDLLYQKSQLRSTPSLFPGRKPPR